jgi:F-type H+-transporting ATPase subunit b
LRVFAYKPLLKLLHDRREKIELGLVKAEEAERRLHEVDEIGKGKIKHAEAEALGILKKTETDAKTLEEKLLSEVKRKEEDALKSAALRLRSQEEDSRKAMEKEAAALVRLAITRTVELSPEKIDDALIAKAVSEAKNNA